MSGLHSLKVQDGGRELAPAQVLAASTDTACLVASALPGPEAVEFNPPSGVTLTRFPRNSCRVSRPPERPYIPGKVATDEKSRYADD